MWLLGQNLESKLKQREDSVLLALVMTTPATETKMTFTFLNCCNVMQPTS